MDRPGCYMLLTANQCVQNGFLPDQTGEQLNPVNSEGRSKEGRNYQKSQEQSIKLEEERFVGCCEREREDEKVQL